MKPFPFKKIDAFADGLASGNPAGCIYLGADTVIAAAEMQRIARELKGFVNEVGYLRPLEDSFALQFYSSECEVEFCGHATIAIMYDLISDSEELRRKPELSLLVGADRLVVVNRVPQEDAVYITAPPPRRLPCPLAAGEIARALAASASDVDAVLPARLINAGLRTLILPLAALDACLALLPPQEELRLFCEQHGVDIILVFARETALASAHFRTRVFAPKYGYLEDPATGSGNAAFGHYLHDQGLWRPDGVIIEQGPSRDNPNIVRLRSVGEGHDRRILFGGRAVLRISGQYCLHG
ncbi:PhzF family phenazine biosynthesis protein [Anaeroselena agilis]|uniref:PhzF family phenazine biosynthesis isomerase n=1 Tax=Anaeroselena agilis TaxID=3063788 RepID=A0ABU3P2H9_9FIRM|nr:PhzF family phenazine biosynthesis isomerase [Selenomonadales bacterium 4137-cl]